MNQAEETVRASLEGTAELSKLVQYKSSLEGKLEMLKKLDKEILDLVLEEEEIEQADLF